MSVGSRLKEIRTGKKLTQQAFARDLESSAGYISEVEADKKMPGSEFLISLSRKFNVSIDWLLTGKEPESVQTFAQIQEKPQPEEALAVPQAPPIYKEDSDPRLAALEAMVRSIYNEGDRSRRSELRDAIEDIYERMKFPGKRSSTPEPEDAVEKSMEEMTEHIARNIENISRNLIYLMGDKSFDEFSARLSPLVSRDQLQDIIDQKDCPSFLLLLEIGRIFKVKVMDIIDGILSAHTEEPYEKRQKESSKDIGRR